MAPPNSSRNVQETLLKQEIDPYLTEATLSALITEALGTSSRCDGYEILTGGCWNRVLAASIAGGKKHLVIKIAPRSQDAGLGREFAVLRYFRAHTSFPVPEPFLLDQSGRRLPGSVLVMEKVPGTVLEEAYPHLGSKERDRVSAEIAHHLVELHRRQETGFGPVELPPEQRSPTWAEFWLPRFDEVIAETDGKGHLPADLLPEIGQVRRHLPQLLGLGPCGTLTHYDIWTGNVMVDFRDGHPFVSAFLDVGGYYADYARELSSMFGLADEQLMRSYRLGHGLDDTFAARFDIYSFKMCLQLVCMYPDNASHLDRARHFLGRVQRFLELC